MIIHNGGLVMGMLAVIIVFAIIAFWPENTKDALVDWEQEGWYR